jgi:hypothetical protein
MSKEVAVASRRVFVAFVLTSLTLHVRMVALGQAYAPTKARVAKFLEAEALLEKACPKCADKDYSDP